MTLFATPIQLFPDHISLLRGWVPVTAQALAAVVLVLALGWRSRRWRLLWLPLAAVVGVGAAVTAHEFITSDGLAGEAAPRQLWVWIALTGVAAAVLVFGWRGATWWRRGAALSAVPLCLLSSALALNSWVGYFPTVQNAWNQLTAGPLPDESSQASVTAAAAQVQLSHVLPAKGSVVAVTIPAQASNFKHRGELVYLPPAWFASNPPPKLPTVMMIGGEFNTPADWLRAGNAITTIDSYATAHGGNAPVFVFVDPGGTFNNDTECVNGPRGNAADHLTKDVVPFMEADFGVSTKPSNWGIVGWSMGGTCAVDLATMHPDLFSSFVDIAGDLTPNSGTKAQTVDRLYGGSLTAWSEFDPSTVMAKHGPYQGVSGWFALNGASRTSFPHARDIAVGNLEPEPDNRAGSTSAADSLCSLGSADGIACAVVAQPGKHDWPFASRVFTAALPWLAGTIGTPGDPTVPLESAARMAAASSAGSAPRQSTEAAGR